MQTFLRSFIVAVVAIPLCWSCLCEYKRADALAEVQNAQARVEREMETIKATREAQEYAAPIVALSEQLASENAMFTEVIDKARSTVTDKTVELAQAREALNDSVELLQDQIEENDRCMDRIRELETVVSQLLEKFPPADRPLPPERFDPLYEVK